ncbi:MAG: nodulation protein NfeD [Gammaproteobacteria bacterium]|nr:nodulation protein NfeD [Gammaproteobacteria bacterium]MYF02694.1 nodulation protein NfeD [Gammaproteobacteria bacterium]
MIRSWRLRTLARLLLGAGILMLGFSQLAANEVRVLTIEGAIGPATSHHITKALEKAADDDVELVVIRLDTPGGLVDSLRVIVQDILSSPVPVCTYVAPNGARAASAGTYLSYASHISAMCPVSNIGSSTPVTMGSTPNNVPGVPGTPDSPNESDETDDAQQNGASAMDRKILEDSVAYIKSLAELRRRNVEWAEKTVREAANLTASEALEINVTDYIAQDVQDLLEQIHGSTIENVNGNTVVMDTEDAMVVEIETDWVYEFLKIITNPNVAYLLLIVGINAIIIELYNPGLGGAGILGIICLVLGAYALHLLPLNYAGLALLVVGVILFIAEAITPSYGIFGLGGIVSFIAGSLLLYDTDIPAFQISFAVVGAISTVTALLLIFVIRTALKQRRKGPVSGLDGLIGKEARVLADFTDEGRVFAEGETWTATADVPLARNDKVVVRDIDGLTLKVERIT